VSLVAKLKKHEAIDIGNKLINVGVGSISNSHLKLLIEAESYNNHTLNIELLQELERKTQILGREDREDQQGSGSLEGDPVAVLLPLRLKTLILMKEIKSNDVNLSVITGHQLVSLIHTLQQMRYVLHLLFQV
jgi:hypothetical protein